MKVVEGGDQAEERNDGCKFVQDEEGGYVCERRIVEGREGWAEEFRCAAEDSLDAVRLGWWLWWRS